MIGTSKGIAWKSSAILAVLALGLFAPLSAVATEPGTAATSNATLAAFADGSVSKTLAFAGGADAASGLTLRLPASAVVADAALDARVAAGSAVSSGALVFDIGADGTADATAAVSVLGATRVELPAAAVNAVVAANANGSAPTDVVVKVKAAAAAAWSVVLDAVEVHYTVQGAVEAGPAFGGEIGAVAVASGEANASVVDLADHFTGGAGANLTYSAQIAAEAEAASGLSVDVNGSKVDLRSDNANWWGEVAVVFAAADAGGQVAFSNEVQVHVTPSPPAVATVRTDVHAKSQAVALAACGSPAFAGSFEIPADAVVTGARVTVDGAAGVSALGGTVGIVAGAKAAAGVSLGGLPSTVELNASALNARVQGGASSWGLVDLEIGADVCPAAAVEVRVSNLSVTYTRGPSNGTAVAQIIAGINVSGQPTAKVQSDTAVVLELATNGSLAADTAVAWFIDGDAAGSGAAITADALCRGNHTIEARATEGSSVRIYTTTVEAAPAQGAQAQIAFDGKVATTVQAGASLIAELRTPEPMAGNASVAWYVDGAFVGRGQVLANLTLAAGTHQVEARDNSSGQVHSHFASVTASGPSTPSGLLGAIAVSALLCAGAAGAVAWRRRR